VRYRSFITHLKELILVHATRSDGKQFHSLTVDIKYEEEKETVLAKGCSDCLLYY